MAIHRTPNDATIQLKRAQTKAPKSSINERNETYTKKDSEVQIYLSGRESQESWKLI